MEAFFRDLKRACLRIYRTIHSGLGDEFYEYLGVGAGGDRTSRIDQFAEDIYLEYLSRYGKIVSEEAGEVGSGELTIVLDPIDGSDNLLSSFPYYGSSVAVFKERECIFSCIVNFANGDFFVKTKGLYKRGNLLSEELHDILANPYARVGLFEKAYANPFVVQELKQRGLKFRSPGAVALSLAYARFVRFVIFIGEIRPYDVEAGLHQCEGLYIFRDSRSIAVCKERELFNTIKQILRRNEDGH